MSTEDDVGLKEKAKPTHYKVICISLYTEDLQALDSKVESLKAKGIRANRSWLLREAMRRLDMSAIKQRDD